MQDVANQIRGVSYKPTDLHESLDSSSVILLRANNIDDGKIKFDDVVYVDKSKVSTDQYLKKGDILICASSGSKQLVGKAASVDFDKECTFGAFCKVVRPDKNVADYIGKYFQSGKYRNIISNLAIGANINNIRNEHIDCLDLPMYSQEKIKEIVHLISKVQLIIEYRKQELFYLDSLIKSRFVEMFGDPVTNTKNLPVATLGELSSLITKGASPSWQGFSYTEDSSQTLFITSENVREGYVDLTDPKYIEDGFNEKQKRSILKKGDFLINIVGASIGRAAQFNLDCKANMNQAAALVRLNDDRIRGKYLLIYLNSEKAQQMYNSMKSDTGRANLSLQDIGNLTILIPSIEEQIAFEKFINHIDKLKVKVQKSLDETQTLFDSLMQKYFG